MTGDVQRTGAPGIDATASDEVLSPQRLVHESTDGQPAMHRNAPFEVSPATGWRISMKACVEAIGDLAQRILERLEAVPVVIGIGRGGVPPGRKIADRLGAHMVVVTATRRPPLAMHMRHDHAIHCDLSALHELGRGQPLAVPLVIVDDLCDTGDTLSAVVNAVTPLVSSAQVCTVTLCRTASAVHGLPDLYVWEVPGRSVVFPWATSVSDTDGMAAKGERSDDAAGRPRRPTG
ncbi:phosphoribosyltransferase [Nonomuraea sp. KM90]|uniref:phosphoribosyltransferase n=1 Tax=Nonomuraea sp. KM90 TaxID=3457428 RepID=UPI003FCC6D2E